MARAGGVYIEWGQPLGRYLTGTFTELINGGLLALAEENGCGLRRVTVTEAGQTRYAQVCGILRRDHQ